MLGASRHSLSRHARPIVVLCCLLGTAIATPAGAAAGVRVHESAGAASSSLRDETARVLRFWTPARMRNARPLDLATGGGTAGAASASLAPNPTVVPDTTIPPFTVIGRIFVRQGGLTGSCSGTAIDSPSRQLVLTAGHCVNTGPLDRKRHSIWSRFLEFVPAYDDGVVPFGAFVAQRGKVFALRQWVRGGNPNFDMGAFLTSPNASGQNVADAVGGGASVVFGQDRHQQFQTFGYPGESGQMMECDAPYLGDDALTFPFPGPPTMAIRCGWRPGASGGGWLINGGGQVDGMTTYTHRHNNRLAFGPYFAPGNVGKLVAGL
jgi:V8-like Glu-specific endopeptidase